MVNLSHYTLVFREKWKRVYYHWFWGLNEGSKTSISGEDLIQSIEQKGEKERQALINKLDRIASYPKFIRGIFWLFNLRQYRKDSYALNAYLSTKLFAAYVSKGMLKAGSISRLTGSVRLTLANTPNFSPLLELLARPGIKRLSHWFQSFYQGELCNLSFDFLSNKEKRSLQHHHPETRMETPSPSPQGANQGFLVTIWMIPSLELLGLQKEEGEWLQLQELKKAYHQSIIKTHPDKTGKDSNQQFREVQEAFNKLKPLASEVNRDTCQQRSEIEIFFSEIEAYFRQQEERVESLSTGISELKAQDKRLEQRLEAYGARAEQIMQRQDDYIEELKRHQENQDEYIKELKRHQENQDEYIAQLKQHKKKQDELIRNVDRVIKLAEYLGYDTTEDDTLEETRSLPEISSLFKSQSSAYKREGFFGQGRQRSLSLNDGFFAQTEAEAESHETTKPQTQETKSALSP